MQLFYSPRNWYFPFFLFIFFTPLVMPTSVYATTESIAIIRENCAQKSIPTANCYTSLSAWEATENRDLVAVDEIAIAQIEGTWINPDTTAVTIDGWTTDATRYIKIYTTTEARHSGVWDTGKYRIENGGNIIVNLEEFTRIDGLQIELTGTFFRYAIKNSVNGVQVSNNIIRTGSGVAVGTETNFSGSWYIFNNIIYSTTSGSGTGIYAYGGSVSSYVYNNTVVGFNLGVYTSWGTTIAKNNIVQNNTNGFYDYPFHTDSDYNISNLVSDAPGANSKDSTTVTFVDSSANNFHLSSSDTGAKDAGVDLSADASLAFTTDIDGETRSSTWDIGADEYGATTSYQCSDSIDNDGDGLTDYPNDPGCTSTTDNDETDVVAPPADTTPPTISAVTAGGITTSSATITWTTNEGAHTELNYSDDAFYQSTASYNNTSIDWSYITSHTVTLTGLSPSTTYHYQIKAQDISSNTTTDLTDYTFTTPAPDTTAPSTPTSLTATAVSSSQINLSWSASTDNTAVTGYKIYRGGTQIATTTSGTTYSNTGLSEATSYSYTVSAYDAAGNESGQSVGVVAVTQSPPLSTVNITSLPFTANQAQTTYILQSDLFLNSGTAIAITADNVVIDGNGFSITYANTGNGTGIQSSYNKKGIEIKNITITQGNYEPQAGEYPHAILIKGRTSDLNIHDNTINITHSGSVSSTFTYAVYVTDTGSSTDINNNIYDNIINLSGTSGAHGIKIYATASFVGSIYGNTITLNNLTLGAGGYPSAIGSPPDMDVYNNTIYMDSSSSYVQGISGGTVRDNTIYMASNQSRGINIGGGAQNRKVYGNNIIITAQGGNSAGIRMRYGSDNNEVYNNTIDASGKGSGAWVAGIRFGGYDYGVQYNITVKNNLIHNNTFIGGTYPISIEEGNFNNNFYRNTIQSSGGPAIYIMSWTTDPLQPNNVENLTFSYENITGTTGYKVLFDNHESFGVTFCESGLTTGDILNQSTSTYSITSAPCTYGSTDITAPSTPTSLTATAVSSSQINLSWSASTDNTAVTGYKIYRGGTQIATTTSGTTYSNTGLSEATSYSYTVSAYDAAGNESGQSVGDNATTQAGGDSATIQGSGSGSWGGSGTSSAVIDTTTSTTTQTNATSTAITLTEQIESTSDSVDEDTPSLPMLTGPFGLKYENEQVKLLQQYLAQDKTIYPEALTTGYYGILTQKAVRKFQCVNMSICDGTPTTTGYGLAGPKTRAKIMEVYQSTDATSQNEVEKEAIAQIESQIKKLQEIVVGLLKQIEEILLQKKF